MTRIITVTDFHELKLPHLDGNRQGQWVTYSEKNCMLYLLNDDRYEIANLSEIDIYKDIHFDTEVKCHAAAARYYSSHGKVYSYYGEWKRALDNTKIVDVDESQVMRFK